MKTRFVILFLFTFFISFFVRFYLLTQNPEGFDQTEAAFGYNAYSVLRTGRDEYGKAFPLILVSIGDYKLSGYMYWQIPFIALFGLNEFSTRFSTVVASMISLLLIYYIVSATLKNRKLALLTLLFMGIAPWHIILSRMGYDPNVALMFCLSSIALFVRWQQNQKLYLLLLSAAGLCFGIITYYAVWVILPFMLIFYWINVFKKLGGKPRLLLATLILFLPLLTIAKVFSVTQGQRLAQDSTYQVHAYPLLQEQIREDGTQFPILFTRIFHNKPFFYSQTLLQNLFTNLSFDFLFLRGDKLDRRFYVPYHGMLYLWAAPFVLFGILYFWKNQTVPKNLLVLGTILVVFLGSAFSEFGSETERTVFAAPLFCFLISYGLLIIYDNVRNHYQHIALIFLTSIGVLLGFNIAYFNHEYYWHANVHEPWGRNFGMHTMLSTLPTLENKYQKIVIPDSAYIYYYFYNHVDPAIAWAEAGQRLNKANFLGLNLRAKIGNYLTMPIDCPSAGKLHVLYVCQGTKIAKNTKVIEVIRYRDNQPAFILLEFMAKESTLPPPKNISFMDNYGLITGGNDLYW